VNRFTLAPPVTGVEPGIDDQVGEVHVLDRALVSDKNTHTPVGMGDGDITEIVIPHAILIETADSDTTGSRTQGTIGNVDVFRNVADKMIAGQFKMVVNEPANGSTFSPIWFFQEYGNTDGCEIAPELLNIHYVLHRIR
jgi:hypothetical protein